MHKKKNWIDSKRGSAGIQLLLIESLNSQYLTANLQRQAGGIPPDGVSYDYSPNDLSVADLDGDSECEIIVKWDPYNSKGNPHSGYAGNVYLDADEMSGTRLWRIDFGQNIFDGVFK